MTKLCSIVLCRCEKNKRKNTIARSKYTYVVANFGNLRGKISQQLAESLGAMSQARFVRPLKRAIISATKRQEKEIGRSKRAATNSVCAALPRMRRAARHFSDRDCASLLRARPPAPSFAAAWPAPSVCPTSPTLTQKGRRAVFASALRYSCQSCLSHPSPDRAVRQNRPPATQPAANCVSGTPSVATRCTVHTRPGTKSRQSPTRNIPAVIGTLGTRATANFASWPASHERRTPTETG